MKLMRAVLGAIAGATISLVPVAATAQEYPARPIRLLIPFTPGGGTDFVSRVVGGKLAETLKWQIVPENRPGASGNLAIELAAKSAPDGYTIVMGQSDNMMLGPYLYANVGYDTIRSFVPIVQVSEAPLILVTNAAGNAPTGGAQSRLVSVADLIAKGKTASGLIWATAGNGSMGHLYGEQFRSVAAIKLLQVPYKGAAPAMTDLMGGQVDVAILSVPSVLPHVRGGKLNPVAVTTSRRSAMLPNTPTLDEAGVKGVDTAIWLGLFAPAGTPAAIVARLNAEVNRVLQLPEVREKISNGGATPVGGSSEEFGAFVHSDYAKWGRIVRDSGVKLE
ncbi:MAG: tripartite tricarboxylate transporter substrate binding protein [Betaproteobacteria bacterium]|nr:tripartite tricarboxylate transporter substrate binding protein [Betaproteobacteria bacterium]